MEQERCVDCPYRWECESGLCLRVLRDEWPVTNVASDGDDKR